jgi:membrane associated rhomboid family serine protease
MNELPFHKRPLVYRYYNATLTLIIVNVGLFLINILFPRTTAYLALTPYLVVRERAVWQVLTYMFVHGGTWHILFNMLALLATLVVNWYTGLAIVPVVGASGAIYGLLLAYATLYPDARLFIFGILPLRAPIAVLLFAGLALFSQLTGTGSGIAHLTHLAGFVFGYLYFLIRMGINPIKVFFRRY